VVLLTQAGFFVGVATWGDAIPLALQLGAVLVAMSTAKRRIAIAASLCALAVFSKQSAVWAPAAIALWLFMRERPQLRRFAVWYGVQVAGLFAAFVVLTHGRFLTVLSLMFSGQRGLASALERPISLLYWFPVRAAPAAILLPFAVVAVARGLRSRQPSIWQLGLLVAAGVLIVIWTDFGTEYNHFVDVVVLIALVAGESWAKDATNPKRLSRDRPLTTVLAVAVAWAMLFSVDQLMIPQVKTAVDTSAVSRSHGGMPARLASFVHRGDLLLSEDPTVPLALGQDPIVEDPFLLPRIGRSHPEYVRWLVQRIDRGAFDEAVLLQRIDRAPSWWYGTLDFGPDVTKAIATHYRLQARVGRYFVYVPRN
jgi:hypothetical protein